MPIKLDRFATPTDYVIPIVDSYGVLPTGKKVDSGTNEDGWYCVRETEKVEVIRPATQLERYRALSDRKTYRVYPSGNEGFPTNFDQLFARGVAQTITVHFMNQPLYSVVVAKRWYDDRLYFYELDQRFQRQLLSEVRNSEPEKILDVSGITPELRFYHLFLSLNATNNNLLRHFGHYDGTMAKRTREARKADIERVLAESMARAGVRLVNFKKLGKGYQVTWRTGGQDVVTNVDKDLRVTSAGFCLSGDDRLHTLETLAFTAKRFQNDEDRELYITRY